MEAVVNLLFPFLSMPKNYDQILKKLASFAFYETYFITLALRANPKFDALFAGIESWGPIGKVSSIIPNHEVLNLFGVVVAFAVAVLTHTFQLHDRVSDVFGIRRKFDYKYILVPLARRVGSEITRDEEVRIGEHREELMRAVFYNYASSRADNPLVDKHDIEHALNAWSWFWVWVEGVIYCVVGIIVAWWFGSNDLAGVFGIISAAFLILAFLQRARLSRYARPQIDRIASDPIAAANVKLRFDALHDRAEH